MDYVGWIDVLIVRVSVLVFVLIFLVAPVVFPRRFGGVALSGLLRVDALEDTTLLHHVVGLRMKLAWPFQGFVVIFLIISSTSEALDCVDLVVVVARSFACDFIMVVTAPVPPFSVVAVVVAPKASVVKTSAVVVPSGKLLVLLGSSDVFSDELFCIIVIGIILGRGEEFGDCARPLAQ